MIEIDQSIKIEQTAQATTLAMSGPMNKRSIQIPAKVKRQALLYLRSKGKNRNAARYILFAAAIFLLLQPDLVDIARRRERIAIDVEYTGQDNVIRGILLQYIRTECGFPADRIFFLQVGKSSSAHQLAWSVNKGDVNADHIVTWDELRNLL